MSVDAIAEQGAPEETAPPVVDIHFPAHDDWLGAEELAALTPAVMRERMEALKPQLAATARATELARRPLDENWNALRAAGLFYHFVPRRYGGLEWTPEDFLDVML